MRILFLFGLLFSISALADSVKIEFNPAKPVAGEVFQAYFRIFTDSEDEPSINFSPSNLEVVGKANQGISTRTIYANGKLTVSREISVVYELVSSKAGTAWLRDISVQLGGNTLRHPSLSVTVLKEPEVAADVFVMADVPKKNLFVGEGVTVRYYLYSKVPVQNLDVKKYPKLNNFLKRFLQEPERTERVTVDGQMYLRSQIYAAKLFPEKAGPLKVDSLSISATYPVSRPGDPFGAFGFSRELKSKTLNSESVTIEVASLPEPVPPHYTGLVGKHEFELEFGQSKLIVNEPLEIKLSVTGGGALENFEAPDILKHSGLEEFESNGDLKIADANLATKIFDYTFLPKENLKIPASQLTLSYLDPDSGKYIPVSLNVPEIEVAGGSSAPKKDEENKEDKEKTTSVEKNEPKVKDRPRELAGPTFLDTGRFSGFVPYLNGFLALVAVLIALSWVVKVKGIPQFGSRQHIPAIFKKGKFEFGEFARWMSPLIDMKGKSPALLIKDSDLEGETKEYFLKILENTEKGEFSYQKNSSGEYRYEPKHFKRLSKYIESASHENTE